MPVSETTLFETDTTYDHYAVVERTYEGRPARVLFSGTRRAAQSGIGLDDDPDLLFDYNQRMLEVANHIYPKHILVIGGGAYTLPTALVTALPDAMITVVELDPGLQQIAEKYFGLVPNERLRLHVGDGREYIANSNDYYDLIIIDVFSELSIPRQFLTLEFVTELSLRVSAGGSVAFNIIASYQGRNSGLIRSQVAAYEQLFTQVDVFPAGYGLTSWLPQNLLLIAQQKPAQDLTHAVRYAAIGPVEAGPEDIYYDKTIAAA